jgi:hypothetical protein
MAKTIWLRAAAAMVCMAMLAGCNGKPEEGGDTSNAAQTDPKNPPPPYPSWANAMIGRPLASNGSTTCKGKIDTVSLKHTGAKKGSEVQGWAWDEGGAKPFERIVFTNSAGVVIGAGSGGGARPDVPQAVTEVKTPNVGWSGVVGALDGRFKAVGLTASGASCTLDSSTL